MQSMCPAKDAAGVEVGSVYRLSWLFGMKETAKSNPKAFSYYSNCCPVITVLPVSSRSAPSEVGK